MTPVLALIFGGLVAVLGMAAYLVHDGHPGWAAGIVAVYVFSTSGTTYIEGDDA